MFGEWKIFGMISEHCEAEVGVGDVGRDVIMDVGDDVPFAVCVCGLFSSAHLRQTVEERKKTALLYCPL